MIQLAIFDMDGTLLDTIEDLGNATNVALKETGHRSDFTIEEMNAFYGSGLRCAIRRALRREEGATLDELLLDDSTEDGNYKDEVDRILAVYNDYYPSHCHIRTAPYAGIPEAIRSIREMGILTAVVSNKNDEPLRILTEKYFPGLFEAAVGVRPELRRKPYPDLTFKVMEELEVAPEHAIYVGDTEIDIMTAANAGIPCISVDWGFRTRAFLEEKGASVICRTPEEMVRRMKEF